METVGASIRNARLSKRLSLRQLAKRVGISATYLSHIEVDHVPPPSPEKLEAIAEELGMDAQALLQESGRWSEHAVKALDSRPALRGLFKLAFAMDEKDVSDILAEIEDRQVKPFRGESLFES